MADDPAGRPTAKEVLSHPWLMTADGAEAHREMGELVRVRMQKLAQLRCGGCVVMPAAPARGEGGRGGCS